MSRPDDLARARHMLDAARSAVAFMRGKTHDDLGKEQMLQLAVVRLVEVIGEAARAVSPATRQAHADIPWVLIGDTRNRLIHGYYDVDLDVLWGIVTSDLPPLIARLEQAFDLAKP